MTNRKQRRFAQANASSHRVAEPTSEAIAYLVTLFNQGNLAGAEAFAQNMTKHFPKFGFGWKVLGAVLKSQGRSAESLEYMEKAISLLPGDAQAYSNMGVTLKELGRLEEAKDCYLRALKIDPKYSEAHSTLGNILKEMGLLHEAEASCRRALEIKPDYAEAHSNLGAILRDQNRLAESEACLRLALEIKPDFADAYCNLGTTLKDIGRLAEAEVSCRRALEINPYLAVAYNNLALTMSDMWRLEEAEHCYRRALELNPNFAEAHSNLGNTLMELGNLEAAEVCYLRSLDIKPDFADAYSNLGVTLNDLGRMEDAEASYRRAMDIKPDAFNFAVQANLMLPTIPASLDDLFSRLEHYKAGIVTLKNAPASLKDSGVNFDPLLFNLAYHNHNNRQVMMELQQLFRERVPELTATSPHLRHWSPPIISSRRIRVGFLSQFFVGHTIGKLYQGYICNLDRSKFEIVIIHTPKARQDAFSQRLNAVADKSIVLPVDFAAQQAAIAAEKLDVLFYPDIGMAPSGYLLAYSRLAPVQAVSWGHPNTTGLDTIDYFVSSTSIEPENAQEHYSERLIRLNRLPCYYQPLIVPAQITERAELGLPVSGTLYVCPQSLFKFHPEFDEILATIADGDPTGHIVLLSGKYNAWTNLLKERWKRFFPVLLKRVLFLPLMPLERFMALIYHADILLDPIHFGSGNSMYEAMVYGTPIVTWPGRFMRGRIVSGAYRQMGVENAPIVGNLEDYAPLALELGRDPERRRFLRHISSDAVGRELLGDIRAVREFETFLEASVEAVGQGKRLPKDWAPTVVC